MKTANFTTLRRFNLIMVALHALQGLAVVLLSKSFLLPISSSYLRYNPVIQKLEPAEYFLFNLSLPWLVAIFFFLSAAFHLLIATAVNKQYEEDLTVGMNRWRWIEYSTSASIMMVAISLLVGVYDFSSLVMIFALTAGMNLLGMVMEWHNQTTKDTNWLAYGIGTFLGAVPWFVVATYLSVSARNGSAAPSFVYWIFVSIFVFFNCFALNMYFHYKKIGPWRNYLYSERAYIILSLVAKSLLAWQVFAGTLRP